MLMDPSYIQAQEKVDRLIREAIASSDPKLSFFPFWKQDEGFPPVQRTAPSGQYPDPGTIFPDQEWG